MGNTGVKSSSELPPGNCAESVKEIIEKQGISNYSTCVTAGSEKGENFVGTIYRIIVSGLDRHGQSAKFNLIIKSATRIPQLRAFAPHREMFLREAHMYQTVLPQLLKMKATASSLEVPELYFASTTELDEYLIFADKQVDGFVMTDRKATLDWNHCALVVQQLANLHAISFVLRKKDYEMFKSLVIPLDDHIGSNLNFKNLLVSHQSVIMERVTKSLHPVNDTAALEKYKKFGPTFFETMFELMAEDQIDEFSVVTHADCWISNLLFKYGDPKYPKKPTNICLLDWQLSRCASPVIDLSYFIYNCTGTKFRLDHFDELIDFYYEKLSEAIRRMGCDPEELYPRHVLQRHMKKFFRYGVCLASQTIHLFTSNEDELPKMEDMKVANQEEFEKWQYESKNNELFNERMSGIIKHAVANDFI